MSDAVIAATITGLFGVLAGGIVAFFALKSKRGEVAVQGASSVEVAEIQSKAETNRVAVESHDKWIVTMFERQSRLEQMVEAQRAEMKDVGIQMARVINDNENMRGMLEKVLVHVEPIASSELKAIMELILEIKEMLAEMKTR